jgi:hypothetical protein
MDIYTRAGEPSYAEQVLQLGEDSAWAAGQLDALHELESIRVQQEGEANPDELGTPPFTPALSRNR